MAVPPGDEADASVGADAGRVLPDVNATADGRHQERAGFKRDDGSGPRKDGDEVRSLVERVITVAEKAGDGTGCIRFEPPAGAQRQIEVGGGREAAERAQGQPKPSTVHPDEFRDSISSDPADRRDIVREKIPNRTRRIGLQGPQIDENPARSLHFRARRGRPEERAEDEHERWNELSKIREPTTHDEIS